MQASLQWLAMSENATVLEDAEKSALLGVELSTCCLALYELLLAGADQALESIPVPDPILEENLEKLFGDQLNRYARAVSALSYHLITEDEKNNNF